MVVIVFRTKLRKDVVLQEMEQLGARFRSVPRCDSTGFPWRKCDSGELLADRTGESRPAPLDGMVKPGRKRFQPRSPLRRRCVGVPGFAQPTDRRCAATSSGAVSIGM